jgi:hypothetical protein
VLCLDFDGTLSPSVDDPGPGQNTPRRSRASRSARFAAVAVLSGRPASYGAAREAPEVRSIGLYGLLEFRDGQVWVDLQLVTAGTAMLAAKDNRRGDEPRRPEVYGRRGGPERRRLQNNQRVADRSMWRVLLHVKVRSHGARVRASSCSVTESMMARFMPHTSAVCSRPAHRRGNCAARWRRQCAAVRTRSRGGTSRYAGRLRPGLD